MKFEMSAYIAVDRETNFREGANSFANRGAILYPIGTTVPVIRTSPQRCIGTAYIKSFEITENLTEVKFTFAPMDCHSEVAKAYLALYLNSKATQSTDDDPYNGEGVFIPGAMGIGGDSVKEPTPKRERPSKRYRSLSDLMDDDDDDY